MYRYSQPTLWQRFTRSLRALSISIRRLLFHLRLRYRSIDPVEHKTIFDADASSPNPASSDAHPASAPPSERTRAGLLLSSNRKATHPLTEENQTHDDHSDDTLDEVPFEPTELDALADQDSSESILAGTAAHVSSQSPSRAATKTRYADATADPSEDVPSGWLNEWFGPTSPRRNAWLFTSVTGVLGMILALLLLFSGHQPSQKPEEVSLASGTGEPDPFEVTETDPEPIPVVEEKPPFEAIKTPEPKPEPVVETQPEPVIEPELKPEPIVVVEVPDKPDPEPEDEFDLRVILLPDPENQGEEFEVTGEETVVNRDEGFDPIEAALWKQSLEIAEGATNPWSDLEQLVPLGPIEPQAVANEANPRREMSSVFVTTQPPRAVQSLLMPYELAVTNRGPSAIDHLRITQTLPAALRLRSTSGVHASSEQDRQLSWEYENLSPQETWGIPLVVIPTEKGTVALQTTLEETIRVTSETLVLTPAIQLEILAEPHAPLNKYHRLMFRMTNTGEVPLKNLRMSVQLSENLWHRFGNKFGFTETSLEVGEVREALLHVKTLKDGHGTLEAKLTTDEGAETAGLVSFAIGSARPIEEKPSDAKPNPSDEKPALVPILEIGDTPTKPPAEEKPVAPDEKPLIPADREPTPTFEKPATDPQPPTQLEDFPPFPGEVEPLPPKKTEDKPNREAPVPAKKAPAEQPDPFEIPLKKQTENDPGPDLFKSDR